MKNKIRIVTFACTAIIICLSIGYASFNKELKLGDIGAIVRVDKDIRITGLEVSDYSTGVIASNLKYSNATVLGDVELPDADSEITFKVEITNFEETEMGIFEISGLPDNLKCEIDYELSDYKLKEKICDSQNNCNLGITKDIYATVSYTDTGYSSSANNSYDLRLYFDFRNYHTINYENLYDIDFQTEIIDGDALTLNVDNGTDFLITNSIGAELVQGTDYSFSNGELILNYVTDDINIKINTPKPLITDVALNDSVNIVNTEVTKYYHTLFNSKVTLSKDDGSSSVTYKIDIKNNGTTNYYYNKTIIENYSNDNIAYEISGINRGDKLTSGSSTSISVTFYYLNSTLPDTSISYYNVLDSILNFEFISENDLIDYNVGSSSGVLLKNSLTSGTIKSIATYYSVTENDNFKIDGENGLYINDTSSSSNLYVIIGLLEEDGYSSTLDPSHVYYSRIENKFVSRGADGHIFQFVFSNYFHNSSIYRYGVPTYSYNNTELADDYVLLSIWGKPKKHTDRTVSGVAISGDYGDAIQIGSSNSGITESYSKNLAVIDLSAIFGVDNEPSKAWCDKNIKFDTETIKWFDE